VNVAEFDVEPDLSRDGAMRLRGLATEYCAPLLQALTRQPDGLAGLRITAVLGLGRLLDGSSLIGKAVADQMGRDCHPVRAVLFDKNGTNNWALGWHQDRTIAVRGKVQVPGFGPWSVKQGIQHVEPPFALIESMMTLRIHFDAVDADNAPLLVALGSHRLGRVPVGAIGAHIEEARPFACLAEEGDAWLYHTPILHASARAMGTGRRRRVLQVDYASQDLPAGLEWLGI
jgi:ectoine hydroxylase-related dioxygenase (phytanoyl-CoA dioxygenase family)